MQRNLQRSRDSLVAFEDMVDTRGRATAERMPRKAATLAGTGIDELGQRQQDLAARIAAIESARAVPALASAAEGRQWVALEGLQSRLAGLPAGPQRDALAERARLLRGTLLWQLDADYKLRLWRVKDSLRASQAALDEARSRIGLVEQAGQTAPRDTAAFAARIDDLEGRVDALRLRIDVTAAAQRDMLARIAVQELETQKQRLASYAMQAQFALASLYDGATAGVSP